MKLFSQRIGKTPIKIEIQTNSIDTDLRNALWNSVTLFWNSILISDNIKSNPDCVQDLLTKLWINFFKNRLDEKPDYCSNFYKYLKHYFFHAEWHEVYDLVDYLPNTYSPGYHESPEDVHNYISYCNKILEKELSAFRFVNNTLAQISSEEEVNSIEETLNISDEYKPVKTHLNRALELFSDRKSPDYRNSIKESISAVESYCAILTKDPKATLGQALKQIEKDHALHAALKSSFSNLYGYTSDADGIRHALLEESTLDNEDAKFMLVSCSAFINYLRQKESKSK
jgi:hypothetical protein